MTPNNPQSLELFGYRIVESKLLDQPKMQLSEQVRKYLTKEFAAEIDQWMLEFFGVNSIIVALNHNTIAMGPLTLAKIKDEMSRNMAYCFPVNKDWN